MALNDISVMSYGGAIMVDDIQMVPEPMTMALMALGSVVLVRRRRA